MRQTPLLLVRLCLPALLTLLLTACGTSYQVSVHALNDGSPAPGSYYILPLDERIDESDLLFRSVRDEVATAFAARNMPLAQRQEDATYVARLAYGMGEPQTVIHTWTSFHYERFYRHGHLHTVLVEEPRVSSRTFYNAHLLIQASRQAGKKEQIWRTEMTVVGRVDDFPRLLHVGMPVLQQTLGSHTGELQYFTVREDSDGLLEIQEP